MKNTLLVSLLLGCGLSAFGAALTPEEALERALPSMKRASSRLAEGKEWTLAYTAQAPEYSGINGCYLFTSHTGFIVTPADDRARPLLGYSEDPAFDSNDMSPEFKWWLEEYSREIQSAADDRALGDETDIKTPEGEIEPLCKTYWNQFAPYNNDCPLDNGHKVVTGCVATALAQVMKYHNWPETGTGEHSYWLRGERISCDFGSTTFDWESMTDSYGRHSTAAERDAVASLMYACGVAVNMAYAPGGSGASTGALPWRMRNNFGYAPTAYNARRPYYDLADWNDLIYNSLKNYGPVQYSGFEGNGEGHSFVCDGYAGKGFFHINWGWGGADNGYYLLTALRPEHYGHSTPQGWGGFNFNQSAIVDLQPDRGGDYQRPVVIDCVGDFHIGQKWSEVGREVLVRGGFWNDGADDLYGQFGLQAVSEKGDTLFLPAEKVLEFRAGALRECYPARLTDELKAGDYVLTPAYRIDGKVYGFNIAPGAPEQEIVRMYEHEGKLHAHFLGAKSGASITATDVEVTGDVAPDKSFHVSSVVENTGDEEWMGEVRVAIFTDEGKLIATSDPYMMDLPAHSEQEFGLSVRLTHVIDRDAFVDGKVQLCIIHNDKDPISAAVDVDLKDTGFSTAVRTIEATASGKLSGIVNIYDLTGIRVGTAAAGTLPATLPAGIYILEDASGQTEKTIVK